MFVPHFTQSVIEVKRGNNSIKFAGALNSWDGGSLSFTDYIGAETKEALMASIFSVAALSAASNSSTLFTLECTSQ